MRMLFTQNYATSTAMVAAAAIATMVMSVVEVPTTTRLAVVVVSSVVTMLCGNLWSAWRREPGWWEAHDDAGS